MTTSAWGAELTLPEWLESIQETDYFQVFQTASRYRDLTLSGVLHVSSQRLGVVRLVYFLVKK